MVKFLKLWLRKLIKKNFSLVEKSPETIDCTDILKKVVILVSTDETLSVIQKAILNKKKGAYLRFGDGDIFLLNGKNEGYQEGSELIQQEMISTFQIKGQDIYKSLSLHSELFGYEQGMYDGNHLLSDSYALNLLQKVHIYFTGHRIYSSVALHFIATSQPEKANAFLKILKSKCGLFIANEKTTDKTKTILFGGVPFIKTPSSNSYTEIERIFDEAKKELAIIEQYSVVVIAMGCSGRILIKRLLKKNYNVFYFDFGSLLDGFDGKNSREWLRHSKIDYTALMENL